MANVSVTLACQQECTYCFARGLADRVPVAATSMNPWQFDEVLTFLRRSGISQVRLLGGEPTLHDDFCWMVDETVRQGFRLLVFSNGLLPEAALQRLERMAPGEISVLVNIGTGALPRRQDVLDRLGSRIIPGLTLSGAAGEVDALVAAVESHREVKSVRLGVAHPQLDGNNAYARPKDYPRIGRTVSKISARMAERGVAVEYDCGLVPVCSPMTPRCRRMRPPAPSDRAADRSPTSCRTGHWCPATRSLASAALHGQTHTGPTRCARG